jgi:hypothetical protein
VNSEFHYPKYFLIIPAGGPAIAFGPNGEWTKPRVILWPDRYRSSTLHSPYDQAK